MKLRLPTFLTNLKIDFQRWKFRRKYKSGTKVDLSNQLKAIQKAEKLSKKRKQRLWVVRIMPGEYVIRSKGDLKAILRKVGLKGRINMFEINESIVHITK